MRTATGVSFALTIAAGYSAFSGFGPNTETVKLLYAYLALMSVVCALVTMAAAKPLKSQPIPVKSETSTSRNQTAIS